MESESVLPASANGGKPRTSHRPRILLVDDEPDLLAELTSLLERFGFCVLTARHGEEALRRIAEERPDLVVLDVLMPRLDGREVLRRLRQAGDWTPVILLTRVGTPAERAFSLQEGADDYLNKPFEPMELVARIQAVLRRARPGKPPLTARRLRCGELVLDRQARKAWRAGVGLALTPRAFALLEFLMLHAGEVLTREHLLDQVWGWAYPVGPRAVDIRIAEIRKALDDDPESPRYIETVVGYGYRFIGDVEGIP
ncbi:response regulator transcription factor [Thermoflexus sp.]|uniref:response regulator transcription factor n=1 Tax=Thermoflexus sp. TaxID=1969742 RepID=UPI002ADD34DF|nr:response regulator transcription factor [Thermoflexus sp.]